MGQLRQRIEGYFAACNSGVAEDVARHFVEHARIYDLNVPVLEGRDTIARFWAETVSKWQGARWTIDSLVEDDRAVAMEWSMTGTANGQPFTVSGSDHYAFEGDLIREVRQYWIFDRANPNRRLLDFPYDTERAFAETA